MKTFLAIFFSAIFSAMGSNWFVVPGGSGSQNGQSWANAWSANGIANVGPGDTVWFAGGTYSESLSVPSVSGTAGNPITYQKVLSSDPSNVTSAVAGWNAAFGTATCTFKADPAFGGNMGYLTFNGRVTNGFSWPAISSAFGGITFNGGNVKNLDFNYMSFTGPGWNANVNTTTPNFAIQIFAGAGHHLGHCIFKGLTQMTTMDVDGVVIEYCQFIDCSGNSGYAHPDTVYSSGVGNMTIRWCYFYQSIGESVFFDGGSSGVIEFYGNVVNSGPQGSGAFFEHKETYTWPGMKIYNNTFVGSWNNGAVFMRGNSNSRPDTLKNNLFWNCGPSVESPMPNPVSDYNGYNTGISSYDGAHSVNNTTNPFVDANDSSINPQNFRPSSSSAWPIGKATNLGSPYNIDMNGNSIAGTIGALAFGPASTPTPGPTPLAPTNLRQTSTSSPAKDRTAGEATSLPPKPMLADTE